ncbi:ABC transporter permease (plasmid) [Limimaricola variabilis]|uniref:ABC transporter permease n=1 Tax=Limimaricola variabilis TaxID=1492771 RepID=UPI002AC8D03F|nr:ABC transporter permease [Limimaricola variabilis]WPY97056.1 ABC transporter permease [Limimaricola variabilis]
MTQTLPGLKPPRFQSFRTIAALMLREMSTRYGRSPGGYVWAVLEPVAAIAILSLAFSMILRAPSLGTSFILFYATGFLPFNIYTHIAAKTGDAMRFSRALLSYPRLTWLDTVLARFFLTLLTELTVFCIVIAAILSIGDTRASLSLGPILVSVAMASTLGLGVGLLNCLLVGLYPVWKTLWGIVNRPLFIASGVFFLYEDMPQAAQDILWWNPVLHVVGEMRRGFYPSYEASYVSFTYGFGLGGMLILLGLVFLRRYHQLVLTD